MFHRDIQTPKESWKYVAQRSIFDKIRGVWIAGETLSRVRYISSQSKQKLRRNWEIKSSKSILIKTGIQTSFAVVIFFVLTWWIIKEFKKVIYSGIPIFRTLIFSNLPITRTESCFPSSVQHCNFTPDISNSPIFRTNFRFPWRFEKSGNPLHYLWHKTSSKLYIQWNPDFLNPHFFEPPDNSNQKLFPLLSRTLQFYPRFLELSNFSNQFLFPFEVRKIGTPLYASCRWTTKKMFGFSM